MRTYFYMCFSGRKQEENTEKVGESSQYKPASSTAATTSSKPGWNFIKCLLFEALDPALLRLIGEQIEIRKNNGKTAVVTIRYAKNGGAFKVICEQYFLLSDILFQVQFEDGHFEWITEDQILVRQPSNDHDRYLLLDLLYYKCMLGITAGLSSLLELSMLLLP